MNLFRYTILILIFGVSILGCGVSPEPNSPPEIYYGEDVCVECGMIINEPKYAAAYYTSDGEAKIFDDLGGLCIHYLENEDEAANIWAHDYGTEEWINAVDATFVVADQIYTPMAFGFVAFKEDAVAVEFAEKMHGDHMDFDGFLMQCQMMTGDQDHDMD